MQKIYGSTQSTITHHRMAFTTERRQQNRAVLYWPVLVMGAAGDPPLETRTENLSASGFYCVCKQQFQVGDQMEAIIRFPHMYRTHYESGLCLKCSVRVVRVESTDAGSAFGVGCRIEDYQLVMEAGFFPSQQTFTQKGGYRD